MRRTRSSTILAILFLCVASTVGRADLTPYSQDFEGLVQPDPAALAGDGWKVFGNVFGPDWSYWYGYGPFAAPNGTPGFSSVAVGQGGSTQGDQQIVVYNDYNNPNHGDGSNAIIEANVFQEQVIGAADVGSTWRFEFDARRGDIGGASMAGAFFKTIDPANNYALTNYIPISLTGIPGAWGRYSLSIPIVPSLQGQILQFGFINWASNYQPSGMFYDNVAFSRVPLGVSLDIKPGSCPNPISPSSRGVLPAALLGTAGFDVNSVNVDSLRLAGVAPIRSAYEDVAEPFAGEPCGCNAAGPDGFFDLSLGFDSREIVNALGSSPGGEIVLTLTGTLLDGTPIEGKDCVIVVGAGGRRGASRETLQDRTDLLRRKPGAAQLEARH